MVINQMELKKMLLQILHTKEPDRKKIIEKFQNYVWKEELIEMNSDIMDVFITLAYDLDFYEPNEDWRKEDKAFYDENRLKIKITEALEKLKNIEKDI